MKRMLCRVTALLLAAAIPLGLAGCGQKPEEVTPAPLSFQPAAFYKTEDVPLNKDGGLWCACVSGGAFYYLLESEDQEVSLYRAAPEDTAARRLEDYAITAPSEDVRVFPMGLKSDGQGRVFLAAEDGVTVLDKKGQELAVLEAQIEPSYSGGDSLVLLSDGSAAALLSAPLPPPPPGSGTGPSIPWTA